MQMSRVDGSTRGRRICWGWRGRQGTDLQISLGLLRETWPRPCTRLPASSAGGRAIAAKTKQSTNPQTRTTAVQAPAGLQARLVSAQPAHTHAPPPPPPPTLAQPARAGRRAAQQTRGRARRRRAAVRRSAKRVSITPPPPPTRTSGTQTPSVYARPGLGLPLHAVTTAHPSRPSVAAAPASAYISRAFQTWSVDSGRHRTSLACGRGLLNRGFAQ